MTASTRKLLAGAALALTALAATGAQAQTAAKPAPFYAQAMIGWSPSRDLEVIGGPLADELAVDGAVLGGAAIGWRPIDNLRLEIEYLYRPGDADQFNDLESVFGFGGADGDFDVQTLMLNGLVEFRVTDWLHPYIGVGAGWAQLDAGPVTSGFIQVSGEDDVFAWQGMAGFVLPITPQIALFADGRVLMSDDVGLTLQPGAQSLSAELKQWSVLAGVRFSFGN